MQLRLFGEFALLNGRADNVKIPLRRGQALLAYLALKQGHGESREVIVDLLWPDRFKEQAQASLRQVLFELRRLPASRGPIVEATRGEVSLGAAVDACDVWAFEASAAATSLDDAEQLLRLYRGPFLDGPLLGSEPFQQWAKIQRARLEGQLETIVLGATTSRDGADADGRAVGMLERLVRASPMCCQAVLRLMEIEADADRCTDAIRHYERYARRLNLELGEDPPAELVDAYATLKSAPTKPRRFAASRRRPAFAHADPWRKTRNDAPVLAVLPFRYDGDERSGNALAAALGEDVTLMLSGCRWFSVLSRSATHSLTPDVPFIPCDFARRTGADYLIYGSVTRRDRLWSVTVELADAETGYIAWAKRYDANDADLLRWGSEVCPLIVAALDPAIAVSECRTINKPALAATGSEAAYRHLVHGYRHFYAGEWPDAKARFRAAIEEDATYAHAHAMLAVTVYLQAQLNRDGRWNAALRTAAQSARRALEIDPSEAKACNVLGQLLDWQGSHETAIDYLDRALALNPSFAQSSTARSFHAVMVGDFENARRFLQIAMRLRVGDAGLGLCLPAKALAELHLGDTTDALHTAHWAARLRPSFWLSRQALATCLWVSGNTESAEKVVADLRRDYRGLTGAEFATWFPYANSELADPIRKALAGSGWS
jgi:DNA-binding SARP family transcriptional activator/tetratricopeptide (TPR) repeat protein